MNERRVISFSLYGSEKKYIQGAIENVYLQRVIYPGWKCRFYVDVETVSEAVLTELNGLGAELILYEGLKGKGQYCNALFWRYEVMNDETIDRFIVRDTDSRLSMRERVCVQEWIESGKSLHVIRDHRHHGHRMMGGTWGGISKETCKLNYQELISDWVGKDQPFLGQKIYPYFYQRNDICVHDYYWFFRDEKDVKPIDVESPNFVGEQVDVE